ncbi:MAG TPA: rubrerythrin family protein [Dehalococcoidia bacterium]|nr:rubrerythrin family protein [Dehalococcoidia bacterium]
MANTADNLKAAFAGESQASTRYLAFARKAEQEGHPQVARLFRAAATAETVHARNHLDTMEGIQSTADNLKEAISGENHEYVQMYPEFIEQAEKEQKPKAVRTFEWARKVEMAHESLYKAALDALQGGGKPRGGDYYVCQVCGFTAEGEAPERCPVCGAPAKQFLKVS